MNWRIEVKFKKDIFDSLGKNLAKSIHDLGISSVSRIEVIFVYNLTGQLSQRQIKTICHELLADRITQQYTFFALPFQDAFLNKQGTHVVEIAYNPGVMDPVEQSTIKGIKDIGIKDIHSANTAKKYILHGKISKKDLDLITDKVLSNKLIQHTVHQFTAQSTSLFPKDQSEDKANIIKVDLISSTDKKLKKISKDGQLFLNIDEMKTIQRYFKKEKRNPTDCELETIAQTWSEHCYHKTFRGDIKYRYFDGKKEKTRIIRNLLKSTIVKATKEINKSWCVSVFHDNAGVIKFDKEDNVCFKVETHNHPSALEPFGGANTGIGGVIRDILGTGLGAKPICCTDVFCFAQPDISFEDLPQGSLHPRRIMNGVISGVRDYGNKMGIPIVNGAILFDKKFVGNPLVYCGNVGIMPKDKVRKKVGKGDLIVVVGGKTGRDGIHGATFSSGELTSESCVVSSGAVQIGDPIQEKKVLDVLMEARDKNLYSALTDCGAGGLSSAVGEMGQELGAKVDLDKVSLKYQGLNYEEIWISESQERMVLSVPPSKREELLRVFLSENVEATVIGEFSGNKRLELFYKGDCVCNLDMEFLHDGNPKITKEAHWVLKKHRNPKIDAQEDLTKKLLEVLSHYNVCSKETVIRQYDHEVQGGSIIKPLCGIHCDGPSDASVIAPKMGSVKGLAISNGINVKYGMIDPFWMAASCIEEAIRQIIAVGGDLRRIAILDNFCWGNPDKPDRLGGLVRAAEACYKIALGYKVPFISGKDSFYNEYLQNNKSIAIPGTLLISAIGIVDDVTKTMTMDFKESGNNIYCIGETYDELGGSIYFDTFAALGNDVPKVNVGEGTKTFTALSKIGKRGLIQSMHDCSEGGMGVALAEMAFSGGLGATVRLDQVLYKGKKKQNDIVLFSESNGRFLAEVTPKNSKRFEKNLTDEGVAFSLIGKVEETPEFIIYGLNKEVCINAFIKDLKEAWQKPLNF